AGPPPCLGRGWADDRRPCSSSQRGPAGRPGRPPGATRWTGASVGSGTRAPDLGGARRRQDSSRGASRGAVFEGIRVPWSTQGTAAGARGVSEEPEGTWRPEQSAPSRRPEQSAPKQELSSPGDPGAEGPGVPRETPRPRGSRDVSTTLERPRG